MAVAVKNGAREFEPEKANIYNFYSSLTCTGYMPLKSGRVAQFLYADSVRNLCMGFHM
jgi:hypothetical protein